LQTPCKYYKDYYNNPKPCTLKIKYKKMKLIKELKRLKGSSPLEDYVIDDILDRCSNNKDVKIFFNDLANSGGCQSGIIPSLIYYEETHAFYNKYASEIDQLKEDIETKTGESMKIDGDVRNFLAWFGFEQTAFEIANKLKINQ